MFKVGWRGTTCGRREQPFNTPSLGQLYPFLCLAPAAACAGCTSSSFSCACLLLPPASSPCAWPAQGAPPRLLPLPPLTPSSSYCPLLHPASGLRRPHLLFLVLLLRPPPLARAAGSRLALLWGRGRRPFHSVSTATIAFLTCGRPCSFPCSSCFDAGRLQHGDFKKFMP